MRAAIAAAIALVPVTALGGALPSPDGAQLETLKFAAATVEFEAGPARRCGLPWQQAHDAIVAYLRVHSLSEDQTRDFLETVAQASNIGATLDFGGDTPPDTAACTRVGRLLAGAVESLAAIP